MDFDQLVASAQTAGAEARVERRRAYRPGSGRATVKKLVAQYLADASNAEVDKAALILHVLRETGFDSPALDVITDDELLRLIATGNRVLAVYRVAAKEGTNDSD
jgi:hypothetical protein